MAGAVVVRGSGNQKHKENSSRLQLQNIQAVLESDGLDEIVLRCWWGVLRSPNDARGARAWRLAVGRLSLLFQ